MSFKDTVEQKVDRVRERSPFVDHVVRTVEHYGHVRGTLLAGSVTYFGFLSVFPILLLAFAAVGVVSGAYPQARETLIEAINSVLPGMVGPQGIDLDDVEKAAGSLAAIGVVTVAYAGLGWLRGMRVALQATFEMEPEEAPGFVRATLFDLLALLLIGLVLFLSVAVSGVLTRLARPVLELFEIGPGADWGLVAVAVVVGVAATTVLFWFLFRLLARPDLPSRPLWGGALLGALGFEVLKQLSTLLLSSAAKQAAFAAFGIALVLVVWINYFSRVVVYAASWAYTARAARGYRESRDAELGRVHGPGLDLVAAAATVEQPRPGEYRRGRRAAQEPLSPEAAAAVGAGAMLGLVALLRRLGRR